MCENMCNSFVSCTLARCFSMCLCACNGHALDRSSLCFHLSAHLQFTCFYTCAYSPLCFTYSCGCNLPEWCILVSAHLCGNCSFHIQVCRQRCLCTCGTCRPSALGWMKKNWTLVHTCCGSPVTHLRLLPGRLYLLHGKPTNINITTWDLLLFVKFPSENYIHCHLRCNFNPRPILLWIWFWNLFETLNTMQSQNP